MGSVFETEVIIYRAQSVWNGIPRMCACVCDCVHVPEKSFLNFSCYVDFCFARWSSQSLATIDYQTEKNLPRKKTNNESILREPCGKRTGSVSFVRISGKVSRDFGSDFFPRSIPFCPAKIRVPIPHGWQDGQR